MWPISHIVLVYCRKALHKHNYIKTRVEEILIPDKLSNKMRILSKQKKQKYAQDISLSVSYIAFLLMIFIYYIQKVQPPKRKQVGICSKLLTIKIKCNSSKSQTYRVVRLSWLIHCEVILEIISYHETDFMGVGRNLKHPRRCREFRNSPAFLPKLRQTTNKFFFFFQGMDHGGSFW